MEKPNQPPFKEKDIPILEQMLLRLKEHKSLNAGDLAEFEKKSQLSAEEKNKRYENYFKIYKLYDNQFSFFDYKGVLTLERYNTSALYNLVEDGGFRGIYKKYLKEVDVYDMEIIKRQKVLDEAKIIHHKASKVKWEFWMSISAIIISLGALAVSIFAFIKIAN